MLGAFAFAAGQFETAVELTRAAVDQDDTSAVAHNDMGAALLALKKPEEALACFERALQLKPGNALMHGNRGNALLALGKADKALESFEKAVKLQPMSAAAHNNRGCAQSRLGRSLEAIRSWKRALELDPSFCDSLSNLANGLAEQGQDDEAARCYRTALSLRPTHAGLHCNFGQQLLRMGHRTEALRVFETALRYEPENPTAKHLVAALRGETPERPPNGYVEQLFDACSGNFERVLVERLQYKTPQLLASSLVDLSPPLPAVWDVLDLGCGTGLSGLAVAAKARQLVGVDVSAGMLAQARERSIYSRLEQQDLVPWMSAEPHHAYDLVIATDVFIYVGRLDEIVKAARRMIRPAGAFAFSGEGMGSSSNTESQAPEFRLNVSGRYSHSQAYLQQLAAGNDYRIEKHATIECRLEHGVPVEGWLAVWRPGA